MSTKLVVKVADIDNQWLDQLRQAHGGATLEIQIHDREPANTLTEAEFWQLIDQLDWSQGEDTEAIVAPVVQLLSALPVAAIFQFQTILAYFLYQLDQQIYAEETGTYRYGGVHNFSVDGFLYARAGVVANGKSFYDRVLADPTQMPKEFSFEPLLFLAPQAYTRKTGKTWDYLPPISYETFSNRAGWGGRSWEDDLLSL